MEASCMKEGKCSKYYCHLAAYLTPRRLPRDLKHQTPYASLADQLKSGQGRQSFDDLQNDKTSDYLLRLDRNCEDPHHRPTATGRQPLP